MRVAARVRSAERRLRRRVRAEGGFTMIVAIGILMITMLLTAAVFAVVQSDAYLSRADLNGKQAYAAAQSGVQAYLYALNDNAANSTWWETCANDSVSQTAVAGSSDASYTYSPVPANGSVSCSTSDPVGTLIDSGTGTLRLKFTGYAGNGCTTATTGCATRTIVASFRTLSPLSFLWYTVYETVDTSIGGNSCKAFYYASPGPPSSCYIYWVTGDHMNGPMYTQDQFLVYNNNSPVFGRAGTNDQIESQAPAGDKVCAFNNCYSASITKAVPNVTPQVPLPADNSNLLTDATNHGKVFSGTTTLTVDPTTNLATGFNCPSSGSCTAVSVDLTKYPIIYATNASGCSTGYNPTNINYNNQITSGTYAGAYYGPCGDVYISGTYSTSFTIGAGNDIVLTGNLLNSTDPAGTTNPTGGATVGLVADQYIRVMHTCSGNPNRTIDAAILTLAHSFFVDNYQCGSGSQGYLTVHGAIAQYFRGIVGTVGSTGYLKNYNYDDRLQLILPPYLFDLQNTQWTVFRETECSTTVSTSASNSCGPAS